MKMLFFSSDSSEVEQVGREFAHAGITCEVRNGNVTLGKSPDSELWIKNDRDCHRAFLLCVQLGIGFARRPDEGAEVEA
jgi:hypothetical protein